MNLTVLSKAVESYALHLIFSLWPKHPDGDDEYAILPAIGISAAGDDDQRPHHAQQQKDVRQPGGHLVPLRLSDVAQELAVHESTVSRAIREKYLQCARGIYPLSYFFSREVGSAGEGNSVHQIKSLLARLVAQEDKEHPLSDQKLCQMLEGEGVTISRRTVAKYRDELGLPSASGRRARPREKETL